MKKAILFLFCKLFLYLCLLRVLPFALSVIADHYEYVLTIALQVVPFGHHCHKYSIYSPVICMSDEKWNLGWEETHINWRFFTIIVSIGMEHWIWRRLITFNCYYRAYVIYKINYIYCYYCLGKIWTFYLIKFAIINKPFLKHVTNSK